MKLVQGNFIGTDITGKVALGNTGSGIVVNAVDLLIGGATPAAANVISSNGMHGIDIDCCSNVSVQGNFIGTDGTATKDLGNGGDGVNIQNTGNHTIGGSASGNGNVIAFNRDDGVTVVSFLSSFTINNAVFSNSIFGNAGLGIDLAQFCMKPQPSPACSKFLITEFGVNYRLSSSPGIEFMNLKGDSIIFRGVPVFSSAPVWGSEALQKRLRLARIKKTVAPTPRRELVLAFPRPSRCSSRMSGIISTTKSRRFQIFSPFRRKVF